MQTTSTLSPLQQLQQHKKMGRDCFSQAAPLTARTFDDVAGACSDDEGEHCLRQTVRICSNSKIEASDMLLLPNNSSSNDVNTFILVEGSSISSCKKGSSSLSKNDETSDRTNSPTAPVEIWHGRISEFLEDEGILSSSPSRKRDDNEQDQQGNRLEDHINKQRSKHLIHQPSIDDASGTAPTASMTTSSFGESSSRRQENYDGDDDESIDLADFVAAAPKQKKRTSSRSNHRTSSKKKSDEEDDGEDADDDDSIDLQAVLSQPAATIKSSKSRLGSKKDVADPVEGDLEEVTSSLKKVSIRGQQRQEPPVKEVTQPNHRPSISSSAYMAHRSSQRRMSEAMSLPALSMHSLHSMTSMVSESSHTSLSLGPSLAGVEEEDEDEEAATVEGDFHQSATALFVSSLVWGESSCSEVHLVHDNALRGRAQYNSEDSYSLDDDDDGSLGGGFLPKSDHSGKFSSSKDGASTASEYSGFQQSRQSLHTSFHESFRSRDGGFCFDFENDDEDDEDDSPLLYSPYKVRSKLAPHPECPAELEQSVTETDRGDELLLEHTDASERVGLGNNEGDDDGSIGLAFEPEESPRTMVQPPPLSPCCLNASEGSLDLGFGGAGGSDSALESENTKAAPKMPLATGNRGPSEGSLDLGFGGPSALSPCLQASESSLDLGFGRGSGSEHGDCAAMTRPAGKPPRKPLATGNRRPSESSLDLGISGGGGGSGLGVLGESGSTVGGPQVSEDSFDLGGLIGVGSTHGGDKAESLPFHISKHEILTKDSDHKKLPHLFFV